MLFFLFNKLTFEPMVCTSKEELPPFSNNSVCDYFFDLFRKTYLGANTHSGIKYPLSRFGDKVLIFNLRTFAPIATTHFFRAGHANGL